MKILLAIDDSDCSAAALRMLVRQNPPSKCSVRVLSCVEPLSQPYYPELAPPYPKSLSEVQKIRLEAAKKTVSDAVKKLAAAGFRATGQVAEGSARGEIVNVAEKWGAGLIVVGSHSRSGLTRLLLGSVSDYVARHAGCSVQIVRMTREETRKKPVAAKPYKGIRIY